MLTAEEFYKRISKDDKNAVVNLSASRKAEFISTGSWPINYAIGDGTLKDQPGGFPRGHITEISGDESAGKTTLLMSGMRQAQEAGEMCVLLDFEQTFHPGYAEAMGLSLDKKKLAVLQPMHFQQGARMINDALQMRPAIIGVDSVSAMTPKEVFEGSVDEAGRPGLQAQLMSAFLGYITKYLKASNTALIFTNQLRAIINIGGGFVPPGAPKEESSGGKALKFYSSLRIKMKKSTVEKVDRISKVTGKKEKEAVNVMIYASIIKNKIDKPFRRVPAYIKFGEGFDNILSMVELGLNLDVIQRRGTLYTFSDGGEQLFAVTGKAQIWTTLNENEKILQRLQKHLVVSEDAEVKQEYENEQDAPVDEMDSMLNNVATGFVEKAKAKKAAKEGDDEE